MTPPLDKTRAGQDPAPVVRLTDAHKSFGPVRALNATSLSVLAGECIGLVGHNGAGKSTLVNLVTGALTASGGTVEYGAGRGTESGADGAGVRAISQEGTLCPNLTVAENLHVAQRDLTGWGWRGVARARMRAALDSIFPGHRIGPDMTVSSLTLAERQMVEIAIGFAQGATPARLVVLDEPTSSLDAAIARQLMDHVRRFCDGGGAVILISHMLGEIFQVASRIAVMKDGRIILDRPADSFTRQGLVDAMGHVAPEATQTDARATPTTLQFRTTAIRTPEGITAAPGEVVGLAGLAGHGQAEALARFYLSQSSDWRARRDPQAVFVAGDRVSDGVMPLWSITRNLSLAGLAALTRFGLVDRGAERARAGDWQRRIAIRTDDLSNPILSLSGGNQQKVLFARALSTDAPVVIMDDPMRGVDVGTKSEVYAMIRAEAERGRIFLWYSTEMDEIRLCDRVCVFRDGAISAVLERGDATEDAILSASFEFGEEAAS
ncbi:ATP-binding cassette domain-containing protein [Paracoccus nototheniae]